MEDKGKERKQKGNELFIKTQSSCSLTDSPLLSSSWLAHPFLSLLFSQNRLQPLLEEDLPRQVEELRHIPPPPPPPPDRFVFLCFFFLSASLGFRQYDDLQRRVEELGHLPPPPPPPDLLSRLPPSLIPKPLASSSISSSCSTSPSSSPRQPPSSHHLASAFPSGASSSVSSPGYVAVASALLPAGEEKEREGEGEEGEEREERKAEKRMSTSLISSSAFASGASSSASSPSHVAAASARASACK